MCCFACLVVRRQSGMVVRFDWKGGPCGWFATFVDLVTFVSFRFVSVRFVGSACSATPKRKHHAPLTVPQPHRSLFVSTMYTPHWYKIKRIAYSDSFAVLYDLHHSYIFSIIVYTKEHRSEQSAPVRRGTHKSMEQRVTEPACSANERILSRICAVELSLP